MKQVLLLLIALLVTTDASLARDDFSRRVNGNLFSLVSANDLKARGISEFGKAWLGPGKIIWGDAVMAHPDQVAQMDYIEAEHYCDQIGNGSRLPKLFDFMRLREQLGVDLYFKTSNSESNYNYNDDSSDMDFDRLNRFSKRKWTSKNPYTPDVLPHLENVFWTNTVIVNYPNLRYAFVGNDATFTSKNSSFPDSKAAVRCVYHEN